MRRRSDFLSVKNIDLTIIRILVFITDRFLPKRAGKIKTNCIKLTAIFKILKTTSSAHSSKCLLF